MGISPYRATVTMPQMEQPYPSVLDFLDGRFPKVGRSCWERRIAQGKVLDEEGTPISSASCYAPQKRIFYYREIENEKVIPFAEEILFQNDELLVACKPHFLPVTPGGDYLSQTLLHRLRESTGIHDLVPLHRIDRETAGIVLFSVNPKTRGRYGGLFLDGSIEKSYDAISAAQIEPGQAEWLVENRLVHGEPWFTMRTEQGSPNARSLIRLVEQRDGAARFQLTPVTGKTHQLRVHMSGLGLQILHDRLYPQLMPQRPDDFDRPLQLLARCVRFRDPLSGRLLEFESSRRLLW
jgi:tRNA pseudouridine32 synthase/23S rRNA pseudouridine746 synthase